MLKIALSGCNGRMGRVISELVAARDDMTIVAGIDMNTVKLSTYPMYADSFEYTGEADVFIDFTSSAALYQLHLLEYCVSRKLPLLLATTGHNEEQLVKIHEAAKIIPIFKSPNMSLGVAVLGDLVKRAARILGGEYDIEIIERHHNKKVDAPSGTAMLLAHDIQEELSFDTELVYDRHDRREARPKNEIGMHALRGGTIVGEHEIVFAGTNEVISISHSAQSREVFASGALYATRFLTGCKPGMYDMRDLVASVK